MDSDEKNGSAHVRPSKVTFLHEPKTLNTTISCSIVGDYYKEFTKRDFTKQRYLGESLEKEFKLLRDVDYVVIKNYNLKQDWGEAI